MKRRSTYNINSTSSRKIHRKPKNSTKRLNYLQKHTTSKNRVKPTTQVKITKKEIEYS